MDHSKEMQRSSLVVINSFDQLKDDIEEALEQKRVYTDLMEVDRLNRGDREDYLMCFNKLYGTRKLPLVFSDEKLIGSGFDVIEKINEYF